MAKMIRLKSITAEKVFNDVVDNLKNFGFEVTDFPEVIKSISKGPKDFHRVNFTKYTKGNQVYEAVRHEFYNHRFDEGGIRQKESTLFRVEESERVPILVARDYTSWETYMQDSEDHEKTRTQTISFDDDLATRGIEEMVA